MLRGKRERLKDPRIRLDHPGLTISHEAVYPYVYEDAWGPWGSGFGRVSGIFCGSLRLFMFYLKGKVVLLELPKSFVTPPSVENAIGLVRRFLPKKTDFERIPSLEISQIENLLNNRPRKCLNYQTPKEVFKSLGGAVTGLI